MSRKPAASPASKWMDLVLARSLELRKAGVLAIGPDSATFAAYVEPPSDEATKNDEGSDDLDALHSPASYPGGFVPGYSITKLGDE